MKMFFFLAAPGFFWIKCAAWLCGMKVLEEHHDGEGQ